MEVSQVSLPLMGGRPERARELWETACVVVGQVWFVHDVDGAGGDALMLTSHARGRKLCWVSPWRTAPDSQKAEGYSIILVG